ncbi:MAG: DUF1189 family protein [Candidatus Izemoplasmatales bacterium]|jgi:hypothetical protein
MFEVFSNAFVKPKLLADYHNKKPWFVILYLFILVLLMSISTFVFLLSTNVSVINDTTTGCTITDNKLVCTPGEYDINQAYSLYNFDLYFLPETNSLDDINNLSPLAIVFQGSKMTMIVNQSLARDIDFDSFGGIESIAQAVNILKVSVILSGIGLNLLSNLFIILMVISISSLSFLRFKPYITYGKVFKLVTFAAAPTAFLFAIWNLLNFDILIFLVLMILAYRPIIALQREIYYRLVNFHGNLKDEPNSNNTVEQDQPDESDSKDDKED